MVSGDIDIRIKGKVGRITLTRPDALNAMTYAMVIAIEHAIDQWRTDDRVEMVLIDAEGSRAFCAGGDIQELYDTGRRGDFEYGRRFWADEYRLNAKIAAYPKPYVSVMDGITMGGGVGISAHGSHRIVTENTMAAMPECGIGLVPDVGGSMILATAPGRIGEFLAMTSARLNAADAIFAGFADHFVAATKLQALKAELTESGKTDAIDQLSTNPEPGNLLARQDQIDRCFAGARAVDILQRLAAEPGEWAQKQITAVRRNCPISVASSLEIIRRVREVPDIVTALTLEYRFTFRSMSNGELLEGIRAAVIDKDRNPNWQRPHLEEITDAMVAAMTAPLGARELQIEKETVP